MKAWLGAFLFTQFVEMPIWVLARRKWPGSAPARPLGIDLLLAFGASALTHPIVWFVFPMLIRRSYWGMVGAAETFAVVFEALYMQRFGLRRAFVVSLAANASSALLGLASRELFGWP